MTVKYLPSGYHTLTPYLIIKGAAKALDFYKKALGAIELMRMPDLNGQIMHAEIQIGDSHLMLADEMPARGFLSAETLGGSPVSLMLYVVDVDASFKKAIAAGAKELVAVQDKFYGDRSGMLIDPFGYTWNLATHIEDLSPEELNKRADEFMKQQVG